MTIYRYYNNPPMCGVENRRRIREYDPAVMFAGLTYHPKWGREEQRFLIIGFKNQKYRLLFELEFGTAGLQELKYDNVTTEQREAIIPAMRERIKKLQVL